MEMKEQPNRALPAVPMQLLFPLSIEESKSRSSLSPKISGNKRRMECPSYSSCSSFMESLSVGSDEEDPDVVSDCESGISGSPGRREGEDRGCGAVAVENGLIRVHEDDRIHEIVSQKLVAGLGNVGNHTTIEAIHRNGFRSLTKKAKLQTFEIFAKAAEKESGGNANVRYAWFGGSKEEINTIVSHGFLPYMINNGSYGHGIYLSPDHFPLGSVKCAVGDENGVRHLLLCRVILGKMEVVASGSGQWHPSSQDQFASVSGVDDLVSPSKYIVWSSNMNTHILPQYVVSFRVCSGELSWSPKKCGGVSTWETDFALDFFSGSHFCTG
ncbi:PREDICTED: probable inactive poly [ADP-ribose] polymerase SRO5 isoform X2 [Ipomoea nil]|uniref:probable inactive poly [ADP-ribose] polymerase SRO5 isoform X2 n=1 Tax=Ipomoea nil TaxID=35883 RepID=UPI0009012BBA|nr:PREDICTED: probable inactive poly [ADP-ribose] polymerase SRO5 isoform X2 [Ipomoea nil]